MLGDRLLIEAHHRRAAASLADRIGDAAAADGRPFILTIGGESGSGKSEMAQALFDELTNRGRCSLILQQDDFYEHPPLTNARRRREDITRVGPQEVRLDRMQRVIDEIRAGETSIDAPLIDYPADRIEGQTIDVADVDVAIVEGTYTTMLKHIDLRVFIDRTFEETRADRRERRREAQDDFLERVLRIEHNIVGAHRAKADVLITKDFHVIGGSAAESSMRDQTQRR